MSTENWLNERDYKIAKSSIAKWPLWKRVIAQTGQPNYAKPLYTKEEVEMEKLKKSKQEAKEEIIKNYLVSIGADLKLVEGFLKEVEGKNGDVLMSLAKAKSYSKNIVSQINVLESLIV